MVPVSLASVRVAALLAILTLFLPILVRQEIFPTPLTPEFFPTTAEVAERCHSLYASAVALFSLPVPELLGLHSSSRGVPTTTAPTTHERDDIAGLVHSIGASERRLAEYDNGSAPTEDVLVSTVKKLGTSVHNLASLLNEKRGVLDLSAQGGFSIVVARIKSAVATLADLVQPKKRAMVQRTSALELSRLVRWARTQQTRQRETKRVLAEAHTRLSREVNSKLAQLQKKLVVEKIRAKIGAKASKLSPTQIYQAFAAGFSAGASAGASTAGEKGASLGDEKRENVAKTPRRSSAESTNEPTATGSSALVHGPQHVLGSSDRADLRNLVEKMVHLKWETVETIGDVDLNAGLRDADEERENDTDVLGTILRTARSKLAAETIAQISAETKKLSDDAPDDVMTSFEQALEELVGLASYLDGDGMHEGSVGSSGAP